MIPIWNPIRSCKAICLIRVIMLIKNNKKLIKMLPIMAHLSKIKEFNISLLLKDKKAR